MKARGGSILFRILGIGSIPIVLFLAITLLLIVPEYRRSVYDQGRRQIEDLAENALAFIGYCYLSAKEGRMSDQQAQEEAKKAVRMMRYGETGNDYFWIMDSRPRMVMHPFRPELEGTDLSGLVDPDGVPMYAEMARLCRESGKGFLEYGWQYYGDTQRVEPKLSYVTAFRQWDWILGTGLYLDQLDSRVRAVTRLMLLVIGAAAVLTFLVIYLLSSGISTALRRVMARMERIEEGDLAGSIAVQGGGEIGRLMEHVNSSTERLRGIVQQINEAATRMAGSSAGLSAAAGRLASGAQDQTVALEETNASMDALADSVEQVAGHARAQAIGIEEAAQVMQRMRQSVAEVSSALADVSNSAQEALRGADAGTEAVQKAVEAIQAISASSEKIAGIITVIGDIADQTNLLALNASIEAARAGEHGRGFAVVAQEVSKLAERSASSTKEIEALIKESERGIASGVRIAQGVLPAMETIIGGAQKTRQTVTALARGVERQAEAIEYLGRATQEVGEMGQRIGTATDAQSAAARQVTGAIGQVNELSRNAAVATEEMRSAIEELADLAQELKTLVEQFHLDDALLPVAAPMEARQAG